MADEACHLIAVCYVLQVKSNLTQRMLPLQLCFVQQCGFIANLCCSHAQLKGSWRDAGFELTSVATVAGTKDKNHTSLLCHALREVARVCPDISQLPTQLLPVSKAADLTVCCSCQLPL